MAENIQHTSRLNAKAQSALQNLQSAEKARSYSDRLKFYKTFAEIVARQEPTIALSCAKQAKSMLGWQ